MTQQTRIAILADGDQHLSTLNAIYQVAARSGEIVVAHAHANWRNESHLLWKSFVERVGFTALTPLSSEKNATDQALIQDALKLMNEDHVDEFWIVSNDRDFIPLRTQLAGKIVRFVFVASSTDIRIDADEGFPLPGNLAAEAIERLTQAFAACEYRDKGVLLTDLWQAVQLKFPGITTQQYGFRKPKDLLIALNSVFEAEIPAAGGDVYIRIHPRHCV